MLGLISAFGLLGYTLLYAATANGGTFSATPWEGLRRSAYDGDTAGGGSGPGTSSWVDTLVGKPGHRGILGNWIAGVVAGKTSGSPEPPADRHASVHREVK